MVQFGEDIFVRFLFFTICLVLVFFVSHTNVFFFSVVAVAPKGGRHDINLQKFDINYFVILFKHVYGRFEIVYIFYLRFDLLDRIVCQKILYCDYF